MYCEVEGRLNWESIAQLQLLPLSGKPVEHRQPRLLLTRLVSQRIGASHHRFNRQITGLIVVSTQIEPATIAGLAGGEYGLLLLNRLHEFILRIAHQRGESARRERFTGIAEPQ